MWLWAAFIVLILSLLALDLGVFHRKAHAITLKGALALSGIWSVSRSPSMCLSIFHMSTTGSGWIFPSTNRTGGWRQLSSSPDMRFVYYTLAAVTLILSGGIIASLISARRVESPGRRKLASRKSQ